MNNKEVVNVFNTEGLCGIANQSFRPKLQGFYKDETFLELLLMSKIAGRTLADRYWTDTAKQDYVAYTYLEVIKGEPSQFKEFLLNKDYDIFFDNYKILKKLDHIEKCRIIQKVAEEYLNLDRKEFNFETGSLKDLYKRIEEGWQLPKYLCIKENFKLIKRIILRYVRPFYGNRVSFLRTFNHSFLAKCGLANVDKLMYNKDLFNLLDEIFPNQFMPWDLKISTKPEDLKGNFETVINYEILIRSELNEDTFRKMYETEKTTDKTPLTDFIKSRRLGFLIKSVTIDDIYNAVPWSGEVYDKMKQGQKYLEQEYRKGRYKFDYRIRDGKDTNKVFLYYAVIENVENKYNIKYPKIENCNTDTTLFIDVLSVATDTLTSYVNDENRTEKEREDLINIFESFNPQKIELKDNEFYTLVEIKLQESKNVNMEFEPDEFEEEDGTGEISKSEKSNKNSKENE